MDSTFLAVRAISTQFAKQLLLPLLLIGIAVYIAFLVLIGIIAYTVSGWWWFLAIVPTLIFLIALGIWLVIRVIISRISPPMSSKQRKATKSFVGRINRVAEHVGTPKFVIFYRIIKDVIVRPADGKTYIGEIAQEPGEMRRAFDELRLLFAK